MPALRFTRSVQANMLILAAIAGALIVNFVYARLSGRDVLRDMLTRVRLASRSLEQWDRFCRENPDRGELIVCLTTTPARVALLPATLKSLLAQSHAPREIRLHVPRWSRRENRAYELPDWLVRLACLRIVECEDAGPATKLLPALASEDPAQRLVVVDDDMLYPPTLLADLDLASREHPGHVICSSGWVVPDDLCDRPTTLRSHLARTPPAPLLATLVRRPTRVDILQGFSGYLVEPRFFLPQAVTDHAQAPPAAFFVDDVWFSAHASVPRLVVPARRFCFDRVRANAFLKSNSLGLINRGGGDHARRNNTLVIRHFADRWMTSQAQPNGGGRLGGEADHATGR